MAIDTTVYALAPHGVYGGADTRVYVLKAEHGLIGGYCLIWNRPVYGSSGGAPATWKCVRAKGTPYLSLKDTPLLWNHDPDNDIGEVFTRSFIKTDAGVFAFATLRDLDLLQMAQLGLLYFSPQIYPVGSDSVVKGGLMTELTLTDNPGTLISRHHLEENRARYRAVDTIRTAIMDYTGAATPEEIGLLPDDVVMTALEWFIGPQSGQSRDDLRRAGIGA